MRGFKQNSEITYDEKELIKENSIDEKPNITIKSNVPVTVEVIWNNEKNSEILHI